MRLKIRKMLLILFGFALGLGIAMVGIPGVMWGCIALIIVSSIGIGFLYGGC